MNRRSENLSHKSRYGRVSTKRKFNEDMHPSLTRSTQPVNGILPKKTKPKSTSSVSTHNSDQFRFTPGDMVWAKIGKYPVWPGIITNDPKSDRYSKEENNASMLHIYYCNDGYKRNWIRLNNIFKFTNKVQIFEEFPNLLKQITRSKLKVKWDRAVDDAESLQTLNKNERIAAFFNNDFSQKIEVPLKKIDQTERSATEHFAGISLKIEPGCTDNYNVTNQKKQTVITNYQKDHPRTLIPELCKLFYTNGWVTGTGGGISIKYDDQIFIAPSGVQKERMEPDDLFVQDINGVDIEIPSHEKKLTKSQCTPIFMCCYNERDAGAIIHIHSPELVKLCLLNPHNELRITGLEMIKGIYNDEKGRYYDNDEEVIIPIIENSKYERDLVDTFQMALMKYPCTSAVVVRNHGMYVWGKDWKSAKTQCECYEYVFNIMVFKKINNL